jgi:hypothetical protein
VSPKEQDLQLLVLQLKESSNNGFLQNMYGHCVIKLKENEGLSTESINIINNIQLNINLGLH